MFTSVIMKHRKTVLRTFLLRFILLFWRGTPTPEQCGCPRAVTWTDTFRHFCAFTSWVLFVRYSVGRHPWLSKSQGQSYPKQFKAPVWKAFFTFNVNFVLPPAGGSLSNRLPVMVNGEVLCLWEAEGEFKVLDVDSSKDLWSNLATHYRKTL